MANDIVLTYCERTDTPVEDVINKRQDQKTVLLRNSLMYLTFKRYEPRIGADMNKRQVYTTIGEEFGMTRHNCYEQITAFTVNMCVFAQSRVYNEVCRVMEGAV